MGFKIEKLWAFLAVDEFGNEGVIGERMPDGSWMPFIGADKARLQSLIPRAVKIAEAQNVTVHLVKFSARRDVELLYQQVRPV